MAVGTLGHVLALLVTPNEQERAQVAQLAKAVQEVTFQHVEVAFVEQGYTGEEPAKAAEEQGIRLEVVKPPEARHGFILLPRRWVGERSLAWMSKSRRLAKDHERLVDSIKGLHFVAFAIPLLHRSIPILTGIPNRL